MFAGAAIQALIAAIIFFVGAGGGWAVKDWKDGAEIARLESREAVATQANAQCAQDIAGVRQGVQVITDAVAEREKAASAAMRDAETVVAKHKTVVAGIKALPPVPAEPEAQCKAIIEEQKAYVAARHADQ